MTGPGRTPPHPDPDPASRRTGAGHGHDLLAAGPVASVLRGRWYPGALQITVAAVFLVVTYELVHGPSDAADNAGSTLMWLVWWPLLPVSIALLGRFWCSVCPFSALSDLVQRMVGARRPVPVVLRRHGTWIVVGGLVVLTWASDVWGLDESPRRSAILVLVLTGLVVTSGALFQRRTFCRYVCFLGGMAGTYARVAPIELRADQDVCRRCTARASCYHGTADVAPCPLFSFPRTLDDNASCNLCARCVRSCPNDALRVRVRPPLSELWRVRKPELEQSLLAIAVLGIVLVENVTMPAGWQGVVTRIGSTTGVTSYPAVFATLVVAMLAVPVGMLVAASRIAARVNRESARSNLTRFGFAVIPLAIGAHVAHTLMDLLAEGRSVVSSLGVAVGRAPTGGSTALLDAGTIHVVQLVLVALGIAGSLVAAGQIARRRPGTPARRRATLVPYVAALGLLGAFTVTLFALPLPVAA